MFGTRRLAKRSIIGAKVSAMYQDGRFYTGVIQSQIAEEGKQSPALFSIRFEETNDEKSVTANNIIAPGFESIISKTLKSGQRVYITMNGREVSGTVAVHDQISDEVVIGVDQGVAEPKQVVRRLDEIRLMESRKSARLSDQDTDYSKLADIAEPKRRIVSHFIDVPVKNPRHRERGSPDELPDLDDVEMEDESIAALALTSLSCSPTSPPFNSAFTDRDLLMGSQSYRDTSGPLSSSVASSGFYSNLSEVNDPSPPRAAPLSESAPDRLLHVPSSPTDDGLDLEENVRHYYYDDDSPKKKVLTETKFQCTWPRCKVVHGTVTEIERHVRTAHLGRDSDSELSDNEEEFYFTEVEEKIDNVTEKFSFMTTSSPPTNLPITDHKALGVFDHDYQRKDHRQTPGTKPSSVPSPGFRPPQTTSTPIPIKMVDGNVRKSLSWQNNQMTSSTALSQQVSSPVRSNRLSPQVRLHQHQSQSPKSHLFSSSSPAHRKPRSEVRKCRKIYGMENRDQWCTQCKWKKACTRFHD